MATITVVFSLDGQMDADILALLESQKRRGEKSKLIREALRFWLEHGGETPAAPRESEPIEKDARITAELQAVVTELRNALRQIRAMGPGPADDADGAGLPQDILEGLLSL